MPFTEAIASRKMCSGPPKQGYAEKKKKKAFDFVTVLKAGLGYNPFRAKSGLFASAGASEGFQSKDEMRITNLAKEGPKMQARASQMAKSITDLRKAYRRANAAEAAGHKDVAKIFRARAKEISKAKVTPVTAAVTTVKPAEAVHTAGGAPQQAQSAGQQLPASWAALVTQAQVQSAFTGTPSKGTGSAFEKHMQAKAKPAMPKDQLSGMQ